jgi:hypothetical protein
MSGKENTERQKPPMNSDPFLLHLRAAGSPSKGWPFEMLEPCAVKVASTVLRGLGAGNSPRLLDPEFN